MKCAVVVAMVMLFAPNGFAGDPAEASHTKEGKPAVDPATDFQGYLRQYIDEARAAGAKPVLVTPVARRTFVDGKIHTALQPYADAMLKVGKEKSVPVIDLHAAAMELFGRLGDQGSADLTAATSDRTHFSRKGALAIARLVAGALPVAVPELRPYLKAVALSEPRIESPVKAFCIDFNWGPKGINGFAGPGVWADASPEEHVRWYEGLGANVIQTFAVSCNGYAWYRGGIIPPQPGLKFNFLTDVVRLGHAKGMRVMGYYCVGANTLWGQKHPDLSYGTPSAPHIPFTRPYLDYLCGSIEDALMRTGMDGFMIDWVWNPSRRTASKEKNAREQWLDCEKAMYRELMNQPFPGEDHLSRSNKLTYERRALDRCWTRIHAAAKRANPNCVVWLSCNNLIHPTVIDSKMFREIDWLMNEHPDPVAIAAVAKMVGPHTKLVQCLVGWGDRHDAQKVLENPGLCKLGIYGFTKPGANSLPLPIADYRSKPVGAFTGNDKNIAVLLRYFHGLPLDYIDPTSPR